MNLSIGFVSEVSSLAQIKKELMSSRLIGIDCETAGSDGLDALTAKIRLLQVATTSQAYVLDLFKLPLAAVWEYVLEPILFNERIIKILQNAKFDLKFLDRTFPDKFILENVKSVVDTYIMDKLVMGGNGFESSSLEAIANRVLGIELDKTYQRYDYRNTIYREQVLYSAIDAAILIPIYQQLSKAIVSNKLQLCAELEFNAIPAVAQLELNGFFLDKDMWIAYALAGKEKLYALEKNLRTYFGDINFASNPQVAKQLSTLTGLNITRTAKEVIQELIDNYTPKKDLFGRENDYRPALEMFQQFKVTSKLQDAFGIKFLNHIHKVTGRIHPSFSQVDTKTGRSTTVSPNLAQIPSVDEIRAAFRAPNPDRKIITLDYSQFEVRILAQLANERSFIEAFNAGHDFHTAMAATRFKCDVSEVTSKQRKSVKPVTFGIPYGAGARHLAQLLKVTEDEARAELNQYYKDHPDLKPYFNKMEKYFQEYGCVRSFSGRLRNVSDFGWSDQHYHIARQASKNFPIQACLHPDSLIFDKERGYKPISSFSWGDVNVWDGDKFVTASVEPTRNKKEEVIVTFEDGLQIRCSREHRFLSTNSCGKWAYKNVEEFHKVTYVKLGNSIPNWSVRTNLPYVENTNEYAEYKPLDNGLFCDKQKFGEWLGRIASDGNVSKTGEIRLLVATHEIAIMGKLIEFSSNFGNVKSSQVEPSLHKVYVCNQVVAKQLKAMGIKQNIPEFVMADRDILIGYLRGMYDGDGTVSPDGASLCFGKGHTKEPWARKIQQALYLLGIRSRLSFCCNRINVNIFKKDIKLFARVVGFINPIKQRKVEKIEPIKKDSKIYGRALKVKSVEFTGNMITMFDVVNSETGKFMVNGVVTHNSNADVMKAAITRMHNELPRDCMLVNQVYDEAVLECDAKDAEELSREVQKIMVEEGEKYIDVVKVEVSRSVGDCWSK